MKNNILSDDIWNLKKKGKRYLKELQKFFDMIENIENEELRFDIVNQMYKCEEKLVELLKVEMLKMNKKCIPVEK